MIEIPAATTIALSATLNIGQYGSSIQSITCPWKNPGERKIRSLKFPRTPPKSHPRRRAQLRSTMRGATYVIATITTKANNESKSVEPVPKLNAAPGFRINVS